MHARRGNVAAATGQAARAVLEEAHAVVCAHGGWVANEKHLIEAGGLEGLQSEFTKVPGDPAGLLGWVELIAERLGVAKDEVLPWKR